MSAFKGMRLNYWYHICLLMLLVTGNWAGWGFYATRIETFIATAIRHCSTPNVTCSRAAIAHSSRHTRSCASHVAIGRWLTQVTLPISSISVPSLARGRCRAVKMVPGYVVHAPALNSKQLAMAFCVWLCFVCWGQVTAMCTFLLQTSEVSLNVSDRITTTSHSGHHGHILDHHLRATCQKLINWFFARPIQIPLLELFFDSIMVCECFSWCCSVYVNLKQGGLGYFVHLFICACAKSSKVEDGCGWNFQSIAYET